jgi:hypothetical protein
MLTGSGLFGDVNKRTMHNTGKVCSREMDTVSWSGSSESEIE